MQVFNECMKLEAFDKSHPPEAAGLAQGNKALRRDRVSRVSHVLTALRLPEVVRYETDGRQAHYHLKHPRETQRLLKALAKFMDSSSAFQ
jgi:hypothetical protein